MLIPAEIPNLDILLAEEGSMVEFFTRLDSPDKRYIGKIESISYKYLTVFHLVPAPGFEDRFPKCKPKLIVVTDTFLVRILETEKQKKEKYGH